MSKKFGHTGTLFIQIGTGRYKWSYKFEHCIKCGKCDKKHKGRGLCTSCRDKQRDKNPKRKETKRKASLKWHKENYKPVIERKKKPKTFDEEKYKKQWYKENQEALLLKAKAYRMIKKGIKCIEMIINGKTKYFPFVSLLEKPPFTGDFKKYEERKEEQRKFEILRKYYHKK